VPKPNAKKRAKFARTAARNARLATPSLPPSVKEAFADDQVGGETVATVVQELAAFRGPDAAFRQSNAYYYSALAKVYDVWRRVSLWPTPARQELLEEFNRANQADGEGGGRRKTTRGSDLHILLRFLIPHGGDSRAEQRLRSRDASALRQAARCGWTPADFADRAKNGQVGLDQLARDDSAARKLEDAPIVKSEERDPERRQSVIREVQPEPAVKRRYKRVIPKSLSQKIQAGHFEGRDLFVRLRFENGEVKPMDVHQPSSKTVVDEAWSTAMAYVDARVVYHRKPRTK